jgi:hypothetical protein
MKVQIMISDVLSDALSDIEEYQQDMPDAHAEVAAEISVVKTIMEALRIVLDAAPGQSEEFNKVLADVRASIRAVDLSRLVTALDRLRERVAEERKQAPLLPRHVKAETGDGPNGWQQLGAVTIDTARLLLVDPIHQGQLECGEEGQITIPGGDFSAVHVPTGIGDGRYRVEGRVVDYPLFGRRLAEIRVRFLDDYGNWLGADAEPGHA